MDCLTRFFASGIYVGEVMGEGGAILFRCPWVMYYVKVELVYQNIRLCITTVALRNKLLRKCLIFKFVKFNLHI
jgi:hypothetical protein